MLPVASRLRRRPEFSSAVRRGRRAGRSSLVVHLLIDPTSENARAGFVVGRSVGGAVMRNRVRRRLRHIVRDRLGELPSGTKLVVRAQPAAAGRTSAQLSHDLDSALRSALRSRSEEAGP